jgi:D-aminoacyl-tRNA deacylase
MRFAVAYSIKDLAGVNIASHFKKKFLPQIPTIELKKDSIFSDNLDSNNYPELRNIDFIVFATRHQSEKKENSLSLHAPGNWRNADFGGKESKVCSTSAFVLKYLFQKLNQNAEIAQSKNKLNKDYRVTLEVTHHGPLIDLPCCFIEIGSSEEQWEDQQAGKVISDTILTLQNFDSAEKSNWIPCIAIGGPHYCPNFNKIQLSSRYAISHIIPEYSLPLTETMLKQAEAKTKEQIKLVLLDWKGLGKSEQKNQALDLLNRSGLKFKKTKEVKK